MIDQGAEMINAVVAGHPDVTFGLHVCRGNDASRYMAKGGYGAIARRLFARVSVQRLLLEYDDERSGDFEPLRAVPDGVDVVLGLITTKWPREETIDDLRARIAEAARYLPLDRLAISPTQCGFASVAGGNAVSMETQERKLRMVSAVARAVWP